MKNNLIKTITLLLAVFAISCSDHKESAGLKPYSEELASRISRGLVCLQKEQSENFLTWRLLPSDPDNPKYYVWRKDISSKNSTPELLTVSNKNYYLDSSVKANKKYAYVVSLIDVVPEDFHEVFPKHSTGVNFEAISFDLGEEYQQANVVTGDLTGDGELEVLIAYSKMRPVDSFKDAWMKSTDTYKLTAFTVDGNRLWTIDLGWGIEAGPVYAPIIIWDLNADGKSEIVLKTNKSQNPKDYSQEYLTLLNGEDGKLIRETRWPDPASTDYNSNSRNYLAIAHLDGIHPSIIAARGTYFKQVVHAYDVNLNLLWERFFGKDIEPRFGNRYLNKIWSWFSNDQNRGSHSLPIVDVDENGTEEIFWGEHCITENGDNLWEVQDRVPYVGHLDIIYSEDIIPEKPGLETYYCREGWLGKMDNIGLLVVDKFGNTIWSKWGLTHVDGGWVSKVLPDMNDFQLFAYDIQKKIWKAGKLTRVSPARHLFNNKGEVLPAPDTTWVRSYPVDFEGDGVREIITRSGDLIRYSGEILKSFKGEIVWAGDLFGDHREELVYTPLDGKVYIVFNTDAIETPSRLTRLADRRYKNDLSRTAMQFNVIPTESGYIPSGIGRKKL